MEHQAGLSRSYAEHMVGWANMADRLQALVQLSRGLVEELDRRAAAQGVSRSRVIRDLLERGLADDREEALEGLLVEGYRRVPQSDGRDAWGDLDAWTSSATRRSLAALAEEETEPW